MHVNERALIGQEVAGYYIQDVVGKGGMAVVYLALDPRLSRKVALKILNPVLSVDDRFRRRFILESRTVASIEHPNIIPIYEASADPEGVLYIAMRYVEGLDLRRYILEHGPLPPPIATNIFAQVAAALDTAHAHDLIHRDVKPANILLAGQAPSQHVYLTDFGITKHRTSISGLTQTDQFIGTPRYMAPEQINKETIDGRCDQYAMACVVYEALTGRLPFERDNDIGMLWAHLAEAPMPLSQLRPELPPAVDAVMMRALAKAPEQRFPDCATFAGALREAISGAPVTLQQPPPTVQPSMQPTMQPSPSLPPSPPTGPRTRPSVPGGRRGLSRTWLVLASVIAALAAVVLVLMVALGGRGQEWTAFKGSAAAPLTFEHPADWTARSHLDLFAVVTPRPEEFEALFLAGADADWTAVAPIISGEPESASGVYVQVSDTLDLNADAEHLKATLDAILPGEVEITRKPVEDRVGTSRAKLFEGTMLDRKGRATRLSVIGYVVERPGKPLLLLYYCAPAACRQDVQKRVVESARLL
ncbi:serine/threonine-protein kinase [Thermoactinospora rubra]|uniref:serine/threonine-protein kinase n=1 Tax=Thermoactinospora rubra TaxID=1088767 RepID=UPI001980FA4B|nr:serine/threonine-protein kinase [Thermoactinospora rubra]